MTFFRCSHDYEDIFRPFLCTKSCDLGIEFGFTFSLEIYKTISSLQYHWTSLWCFLSIEFHHNWINQQKSLCVLLWGFLWPSNVQSDLNRSWKQQLLTHLEATRHFRRPKVIFTNRPLGTWKNPQVVTTSEEKDPKQFIEGMKHLHIQMTSEKWWFQNPRCLCFLKRPYYPWTILLPEEVRTTTLVS